MVQSRPARLHLWKMDDGSRIEASSLAEAIQIYKSKNEKA